jgi:hypothetical protein
VDVKVETLSSQPFALAPNGKPELYGMAAGHDALSAYPGLGVTAPPPSKSRDTLALGHRARRRIRPAGHPSRPYQLNLSTAPESRSGIEG